MKVFIDTSAMYALIDAADSRHSQARQIWTRLEDSGDSLCTSNYTMVETLALLQRRVGMQAINQAQHVLGLALEISFVDSEVHYRAMGMFLAESKRALSLVDCVSFVLCQKLGIHSVFAFDQHFAEFGFNLIAA